MGRSRPDRGPRTVGATPRFDPEPGRIQRAFGNGDRRRAHEPGTEGRLPPDARTEGFEASKTVVGQDQPDQDPLGEAPWGQAWPGFDRGT